MNTIFEIRQKEIELLEDVQLVDLMNHLLSAEADKIGIPPNKVRTSLRINDPDAGVDAEIVGQEGLGERRWIPSGLSIWQFKSGGISPGDIKPEFDKTGVQEAVHKGGTYCFVVGRDYVPTDKNSREEVLNKCFQGISLTPKYRFFTAGDIARWASEHLAITLLSHFERQIGDLMRFETWADDPKHQIPFQPEERRTQIINKIKEMIQNGSQLYSVRIEGLAGVGKTRLAMESLRIPNLTERVLYAIFPSEILPGFFSWVEHNPHVNLILVVDECDANSAQRLSQQTERCQGRIKLITIAQSTRPRLPPSLPEGIFILEQLSEEVLEKIIKGINPDIPPEAINFIINVSSGYVKLATELTKSYLKNPALVSAKDMAREYNVQKILENLIPEENKRKGMKAISLLTRVGWEGDLAPEGQALASFMNIEWGELQDIIEEMRKTGLVVKQGRYRYVTPHLLGIWLASEVWDARGDAILELIDNLPTVESKRKLLERLADLGDNERAQQVVGKLLSEEGIFPDLKALDSAKRSQIFSILAESHPKAGLSTLERILIDIPRDKLLMFKAGRREIVWTLEKLAWLPETFFGAARILLALAEAENESFANNATGIWAGLFRTHLGGTAVPAIERHKLIKETMESESVERRILAIKGIDAALSVHESRMESGELQRGRLVPPEWHPRTLEEEINVRKSALELLDVSLKDQDERVSNEARKVLLESALRLFSRGMAEEMLDRLEQLDAKTYKQKFDLRSTIERILEYEKSTLTEELKNRIEKFKASIIGDTFRDRLRRWVGPRTHKDWSEEGRQNIEKQIAALAQEAYKNPDLLLKEINWLASEEAENALFFTRNLGQIDKSKKLLPEFVKVARQKKGIIMLSGYLIGRADDAEKAWREDLLDNWAIEPDLADAVLDATWRGSPSSRGAKRLLSLIENKKLDPKSLRVLIFGAWTDTLPSDIIIEIISHLIKTNEPLAVEAALSMMHSWIKEHPEKLAGISSVTWQLIECPVALGGGTMMSYHWGKIAEYFADEDPIRIVKAILKAYSKAEQVIMRDDVGIKLLEKATNKSPETVWEEVSKILLKKGDIRAFRLSFALRGWYGNLFDADFLIEWAKKHPDSSPSIVANIASVGGIKLNELTRSLLINFPKNKVVGARLRGSFLSGTFGGSEVSWFEGKLKNVKSWMKDSNPIIQLWAKDLEKIIEEDIKMAKLREEEEEF